MSWILLFVAGALETVWAASMKLSDGFARFWPGAVTMVAAGLSFWCLALAMKGLPLGTAYPIWVGIGAVGSVGAGAWLMGEPVTVLRLVSVALIVAGIAGLALSETGRT